MSVVGRVESLWRYPVKSMRGEELREAYLDSHGVYGDRLYGFHSSAAPSDFPYFTAREREEMLLYQPAYRDTARMAVVTKGSETVPPRPTSLVDVATPSGEVLAIDDPALIAMLRKGLPDSSRVALLRSDRPMTDSRPISLFSMQTAQQLGEEVGIEVDKRRFRANLYADFASAKGFAEDEFVGRKLRIGNDVVLAVQKRTTRCKIITLDPDTAQANPEVMKRVARSHDSKAGVYAAVIVEGTIRMGDEIILLD